jgi:hypothetical protein
MYTVSASLKLVFPGLYLIVTSSPAFTIVGSHVMMCCCCFTVTMRAFRRFSARSTFLAASQIFLFSASMIRCSASFLMRF